MRYITRSPVEEKSFPEDLWPRHSRYQVVDKTIRPADGGRVQAYNPWDLYRETMNARRTVETPYSDFLDLGRQLAPDLFKYLSSGAFEPEQEAAITGWCSRFGSIGLLASTAVEILLPVVTEKNSKGEASRRQTRYYRTGGRWSWQQWTPAKDTDPYVLFWCWDLRQWERANFGELALSFPGFKDPQLQYPHFNSPDFMRFYGEPVAAFARMCARFYEASQIISNHLRGVSPLLPGMSKDRALFALDESFAHLDSLRQGLGPPTLSPAGNWP